MQAAPNDEMLRGWFAEGFCFAYSFEEMESVRSESDHGKEHDAADATPE